MHAVYVVITFLSFLSLISPFPFLSSFTFNFLFRLPNHCSCSPYGYCLIYMPNPTHVISHFYPCCSPTIFFCCRHSSGMPNAIWVQPPLPLDCGQGFLSLSLPTPRQTLFYTFCRVSLSLSLNGKTLGLFLFFPSTMH